MAESLAQSLSSISLAAATISHQAASAETSWASQLPADVKATKTQLFKPKVAKSVQLKPVIVVALDSTDVGSSSVLAKELGYKEMRAAAEDLWKEYLGADKDAGES